ncbi:cell filamentation protein Fic, partial [bacterium]
MLNMPNKNKKIILNNNFTEFLLYTTPNGKVNVEIFLHDENIWLTQARIAELFGVDRSVITKHLKNIFDSNELSKNVVCANFAHTEYGAIKRKQDKDYISDFDRE